MANRTNKRQQRSGAALARSHGGHAQFPLSFQVTRPESHTHVPTPKERRKARWDFRVANLGSLFLEWAVWAMTERAIEPVSEETPHFVIAAQTMTDALLTQSVIHALVKGATPAVTIAYEGGNDVG